MKKILTSIIILLITISYAKKNEEIKSVEVSKTISIKNYQNHLKREGGSYYKLSKKRVKIEASSFLVDKRYQYPPQNIIDNNINSSWAEGVSGFGKGQWIKLTLNLKGLKGYLSHFDIIPGYSKSKAHFKKNNRLKSILLKDGKNSPILKVKFKDKYKYHSLSFDKRYGSKREIYIYIEDVYKGHKYDDTCIGEINLYMYNPSKKKRTVLIKNNYQLAQFFKKGGIATIQKGTYYLDYARLNAKNIREKNLILNANGKVVIKLKKRNSEGHTINLLNFNLIKFKNITFQAIVDQEILYLENINNIKIENSSFLGSYNGSTIKIKNSNKLIVNKSRIEGGDSRGIDAELNSHATISNTLFFAGVGAFLVINGQDIYSSDVKRAGHIDVDIINNNFYSEALEYSTFVSQLMTKYKTKDQLLPILKEYKKNRKKLFFLYDVKYKIDNNILKFYFILDKDFYYYLKDLDSNEISIHETRDKIYEYEYEVFGKSISYYLKLNYPDKGKIKLLYNRESTHP